MTAIAATRPGGPARNGLPAAPRYTWRARRTPWTLAALAAAEARYGPPVPTCVCGHLLVHARGAYARCPACGRCAYHGPG